MSHTAEWLHEHVVVHCYLWEMILRNLAALPVRLLGRKKISNLAYYGFGFLLLFVKKMVKY